MWVTGRSRELGRCVLVARRASCSCGSGPACPSGPVHGFPDLGLWSVLPISLAVPFSPPVLLYNNRVEVRESALKHGCSVDDIRHAITNALAAYNDLDDPYVLYLGPDIAGTLLEVLTAVDEQGEEIAFHAMPMRHKYRRLLP